MRKPREQDTVHAILLYLRTRGVLAWRMNSRVVMLPGRGGKPAPYRMGGVKGMADIIGCVRMWEGEPSAPCSVKDAAVVGRFLAIEVKTATGRVTPEQTAFLQAVVQAGGIAFVARSVQDVADKLGLA